MQHCSGFKPRIKGCETKETLVLQSTQSKLYSPQDFSLFCFGDYPQSSSASFSSSFINKPTSKPSKNWSKQSCTVLSPTTFTSVEFCCFLKNCVKGLDVLNWIMRGFMSSSFGRQPTTRLGTQPCKETSWPPLIGTQSPQINMTSVMLFNSRHPLPLRLVQYRQKNVWV